MFFTRQAIILLSACQAAIITTSWVTLQAYGPPFLNHKPPKATCPLRWFFPSDLLQRPLCGYPGGSGGVFRYGPTLDVALLVTSQDSVMLLLKYAGCLALVPFPAASHLPDICFGQTLPRGCGPFIYSCWPCNLELALCGVIVIAISTFLEPI